MMTMGGEVDSYPFTILNSCMLLGMDHYGVIFIYSSALLQVEKGSHGYCSYLCNIVNLFFLYLVKFI